jgi:hypothetical protein
MTSNEEAIQELPQVLQSLILDSLPLRIMRDLARVSRERRPAFAARLAEREISLNNFKEWWLSF